MTNKKTFLQTATLIEDILGVKKVRVVPELNPQDKHVYIVYGPVDSSDLLLRCGGLVDAIVACVSPQRNYNDVFIYISQLTIHHSFIYIAKIRWLCVVSFIFLVLVVLIDFEGNKEQFGESFSCSVRYINMM